MNEWMNTNGLLAFIERKVKVFSGYRRDFFPPPSSSSAHCNVAKAGQLLSGQKPAFGVEQPDWGVSYLVATAPHDSSFFCLWQMALKHSCTIGILVNPGLGGGRPALLHCAPCTVVSSSVFSSVRWRSLHFLQRTVISSPDNITKWWTYSIGSVNSCYRRCLLWNT